MKIYPAGEEPKSKSTEKSKMPKMETYPLVLQFQSYEKPERIAKEIEGLAKNIASHFEGRLDFVGGVDPEFPAWKTFMKKYAEYGRDNGRIEIRNLNND